MAFNGGVGAGVGVDVQYDSNLNADKFQGSLAFYLFKTVHNKAPLAHGPELTWITSVSPSPFGNNTFIPAWGLYYTPFPAPVAIGAGAGVTLTFNEGQDVVVGTQMFPLRLVWVLP